MKIAIICALLAGKFKFLTFYFNHSERSPLYYLLFQTLIPSIFKFNLNLSFSNLQLPTLSRSLRSLVLHHQLSHAQTPCAKEELMETSNTTTTADTTHTTSSNVQTDQLSVKPVGHCLSNSVKDATNVYTLDQTIVSPPSHGHQPPPSNAQTNVPIVDPTSVETLLTQATHINMSLASTVQLSDVLPAQKDYNSTRNGTPVSTTESTRPSQHIK